MGKIEIELFWDKAPKASENFKCLCTGEKGNNKMGKERTFKKSFFHRIIGNFMMQGGDYTSSTTDPPQPGNGSGGESVFDDGKFEDENLN